MEASCRAGHRRPQFDVCGLLTRGCCIHSLIACLQLPPQSYFRASRVDVTIKFIDPTYSIRAVPGIAADQVRDGAGPRAGANGGKLCQYLYVDRSGHMGGEWSPLELGINGPIVPTRAAG